MNRRSPASSTGDTPSTALAALAGVVLAARPRSLASTVLDTVMAAVPANPAARPTPTHAARWLSIGR